MKKTILLLLLSINFLLMSQNASYSCSSQKIKSFRAFHNKSSQDLSLMDKYDIKFVKLDLEVINTSRYISGKCTHLVKVTSSSLATFVFELSDSLTVSNVNIGGSSSSFTHSNNELTINSSINYTMNDLVEIEISYSGTGPEGAGFNGESGIYNDISPTWGVNVTWTLSEPNQAFTWWPCKQVLTDKIDSTELIFTTLNNLKVGSNGLLVSEDAIVGNKMKYTWKSHYPIDYYLISFAVAPYQDYSYKILIPNTTDSLLIQNFIYDVPSYLSNFENDILETGDMILHFSELYGKYPFVNEKYGHCIAPLGGGMEHQTMTTQGFFANWLTVHELGHQWWGDNVTCATWNDIWLNEGFASYTEYLYYQHFDSQQTADIDMQNRHDNIMSEDSGSVYVYDISSSNNIFDSRLVYDKGAAVVHMLRNCINDDAVFFDALKSFQMEFKDGTASTSDLNNSLLNSTGIDFTKFFSSWVFGNGYPTYSGEYNILDDTLFLHIDQSSSVSGSLDSFYSCLELKVFFSDQTDTILRLQHSKLTENAYFLINKSIDSITIDPNNWIVNKAENLTENTSFHFQVIDGVNNENIKENLVANNPFKDVLNLELNDLTKINSINIYNTLGKLIYSKFNNLEKVSKINTATWENGIYIVTIKTKNNTYTRKLLKE